MARKFSASLSYQAATPAELLELAQEAFDEVALTESDRMAVQDKPIAAFSVVSESPRPKKYLLRPPAMPVTTISRRTGMTWIEDGLQ